LPQLRRRLLGKAGSRAINSIFWDFCLNSSGKPIPIQIHLVCAEFAQRDSVAARQYLLLRARQRHPATKSSTPFKALQLEAKYGNFIDWMLAQKPALGARCCSAYKKHLTWPSVETVSEEIL